MRGPRRLLTFFMAVIVLWTIGFIKFNGDLVTKQNLANAPKSDGIVVLTGGVGRINAGLNLIKADKGKKLLISGVDPSVATTTLAALSGYSEDLFSCCVVLGREATNTVGNALEAREWAKNEGYKSLTIVTAHYHMPRAMLAFKTQTEGLTLTPISIEAEVSMRYLIIEYNKYLIALFKGAVA